MVNALIQPGHDSDFALSALSQRARLWLLTVACFGVLVVISSMVALNTALPDIATATLATQTQLTWIVDSYPWPSPVCCYRLVLSVIATVGAARCWSVWRYRRGILGAGRAVRPDDRHRLPRGCRCGRGAHHARHAVADHCRLPEGGAEQSSWHLGGVAGSGAVIGMLGSGGLLNFWSWHSIFWAFAGASLTIFALTLTIASSRDADAKPLDWRGRSSSAVRWRPSSSASSSAGARGPTHW